MTPGEGVVAKTRPLRNPAPDFRTKVSSSRFFPSPFFADLARAEARSRP
jgi:hypothetical protein